MEKKKKPKMRDLSVSPEEGFNVEYLVQKKRERERKAQLLNNAYNKQFSMFKDPRITAVWLLGGTFLAIMMAEFIGLLMHSPPIPI